MSSDIIKRLREFGVTSGMILREDIHAAADRIEALEGEVARLRVALEDIKRLSRHRLTDKCDAINQRASEALSTSGSDASASPEGCDTDQPPSGIAPRPLGKT
jgi:hypothetical protein